jgi:hypothetical protein
MTNDQLAAVVAATPGVLGLLLEGNLRPTLQFVLDALILIENKHNTNGTSVNDDKNSVALLRKCILKHPQKLAQSLDNTRGRRNYFNEIDRLGVVDMANKTSLAAMMLVATPLAYSLSLKHISEKIEYLAAIWDSPAPTATLSRSDEINEINYTHGSCIARASLSDCLRVYPQILTLSMEGNIKVCLCNIDLFTNWLEFAYNMIQMHCTANNCILQYVWLHSAHSKWAATKAYLQYSTKSINDPWQIYCELFVQSAFT